MTAKKNKYIVFKVVFIFLAIALLLRVASPYVIQDYINGKLDHTEGISGSVGDVDIALFRGGYSIKDIKIFTVEGIDNAKPLLSVDEIDLSISWPALLKGHLVTEMLFFHPQVAIYDKKRDTQEQNDQVKDETTWIGLANNLVLFSIDRLDIYNGKITLLNNFNGSERATNLSNINGYIFNITNAQNLDDSLVTEFNLKAAIMGKAQAKLDGKLDPFSEKANFDINLELQKFSVNSIDTLLQVYTPFDVEAGRIDGAIELACNDNKLDGYVKAGVYDLSIFSWRADVEKDGDSFFTLLFEGTADLISQFLENDQSDLLAARIPISGKLDNTEISTFSAVMSVMQNAFFDAFEMKVDNIISFEDTNEQEDT